MDDNSWASLDHDTAGFGDGAFSLTINTKAATIDADSTETEEETLVFSNDGSEQWDADFWDADEETFVFSTPPLSPSNYTAPLSPPNSPRIFSGVGEYLRDQVLMKRRWCFLEVLLL